MQKTILIALNKCKLHEIRNGKYTGTDPVDCECVVRGSEWEVMGYVVLAITLTIRTLQERKRHQLRNKIN